MFLSVKCFYIIRWISHAMLDIRTFLVNISAFIETFLRTSVLHHSGFEKCL